MKSISAYNNKCTSLSAHTYFQRKERSLDISAFEKYRRVYICIETVVIQYSV